MKIGVTGAAGHIGTAICHELVRQGHEVNALVFRDNSSLKDLPVKYFSGDISDKKSLTNWAKHCEYIIHAAAGFGLAKNQDPRLFQLNVTGTQNVIDVAIEYSIKRLVYISSIVVFSSHPQNIMMDESREFVRDGSFDYWITKRDAHLLVKDSSKKGLDIVIVCPTSVIGPPDKKPSKIGNALINIYQRKIPFIFEGGFDFTDVRDVAFGIVGALLDGHSGETYILGGHYHTIKEFADMVLKIKGSWRRAIRLPYQIVYAALPFVSLYAGITHTQPLYEAGYIDTLRHSNKFISSEKARRHFGYLSRPLEETIYDTILYFKNSGKLK
ncbi:MAG: NAD-dependent epimerase/dehydratase family protein [Saprospiraceae bacterium]|nr:NAD-dependent epimerase/dehydratase family protein [Saprospiraceae bacterium]